MKTCFADSSDQHPFFLDLHIWSSKALIFRIFALWMNVTHGYLSSSYQLESFKFWFNKCFTWSCFRFIQSRPCARRDKEMATRSNESEKSDTWSKKKMLLIYYYVLVSVQRRKVVFFIYNGLDWFCLFDKWHVNFRRLTNAKAILVED